MKADVVFPELRLVTYESGGKAVPVVAVAGDFIPKSEVIAKPVMAEHLRLLCEMLLSQITVRQETGSLTLPDNHDNHPGISVGKQLLHACEAGKAGYKCMVMDDARIEGRKYLIIQVDKK